MIYDFIVLGAGASGLFFAANRRAGTVPSSILPTGLTRSGQTAAVPSSGRVLLLEKQERPGRKLLLSGGGKCNVTNRSVGPENYLGADPQCCAPALAAFGPERMLDFLRRQGIGLEEREHGQIFCKGGAEQLRDLLLRLALERGASLRLGQNLQAVRSLEQGWCWESKSGGAAKMLPVKDGSQARFEVLSNGKRFLAANLLLASGGKAWPRSGASSFGYALAQAAGHALVTPRPALTPLPMPADWPLHGLQGLSLLAETSLASAQNKTPDKKQGKEASGAPGRMPAFRLPLLFTHSGLSGPACLQISSYLNKDDLLQVDFLPTENFEDLLDAREHARLSLLGLARRVLPERLAIALLGAAGLGDYLPRKVAELGRAVRVRAAKAVHEHRVRPEAPNFSQAESTSGGVATAFVDAATMQSKLTPGLYFSGEVLDVCGQLGGYNLHWAWASSALASRAL